MHTLLCVYLFFLTASGPHPDLHSFPTRRSSDLHGAGSRGGETRCGSAWRGRISACRLCASRPAAADLGPVDCRALTAGRSEEHTSELQSRRDLVCRLLLEKKKKIIHPPHSGMAA